MKKRRRINDILLITALILIPIVMLIYSNLQQSTDINAFVLISIDGIEYKTLPLSDNVEFTITTNTGNNTVIIKDGSVWISDADCLNQVCVDHSSISKKGEQIVCLPHKVVLEIISEEESDIDSISQ